MVTEGVVINVGIPNVLELVVMFPLIYSVG